MFSQKPTSTVSSKLQDDRNPTKPLLSWICTVVVLLLFKFEEDKLYLYRIFRNQRYNVFSKKMYLTT